MFLLRLLILFLFCYLAFSALKAMVKPTNKRRPRKVEPQTGGEDMVLDPQCQSYISVSNAVAHAGRYFCSRDCARLYLSR